MLRLKPVVSWFVYEFLIRIETMNTDNNMEYALLIAHMYENDRQTSKEQPFIFSMAALTPLHHFYTRRLSSGFASLMRRILSKFKERLKAMSLKHPSPAAI